MTTNGFAKRLEWLERLAVPVEVAQIPIINPDLWPVDVRAAYDTARISGDVERQADVIEQMTGIRPRFGGPGVPVIRDHAAVVELTGVDPADI